MNASDTTALRILLTGSNGQVGWELRRSMASLGDLAAMDRHSFDLTNPEQVRTVIRTVRPHVIVNAAAYTAVDRAEAEPDLAMQINATAPAIMAEEAKSVGAMLVHYSTDYVFDGTKCQPYVEEDPSSPLNVYGQSKLAGEKAIQTVGGRFLIFRTSWVYGARGNNFLLTILRRARSHHELRIVDDQFGAPTWSRTIAETTTAVLRQAMTGDPSPQSGLFHLTADGVTTWYGFAQRALDRLNLTTAVTPIMTAEYPVRAQRPPYSVLSTGKLRSRFQLTLPAWEASLEEVIRELKLLENSPLAIP